MSYRVKQLRQTGPGVVAPPAVTANSGMNAAGGLMALQTAVFDVEATELALTAQQLEAMLAARTLKTSDLVFFDGGWMSIADCPDFAEAAVPFAKDEAKQRTISAARLFFFSLLLVIATGLLRFH